MIPARNRAAVIGRAVASACAQTLPPAEIIVVDDGSDDGGATIEAARAAMRDEIPLRIIELGERGGAPSARNRGIAEAQGDWIALLDSDDAFAPEKLEVCARAITPEVSAVFTDTRFETESGATYTLYAGKPVDTRDLVYSNVLGGCSATVIRRESFESAGGFDPALPSCQDWDLWLKLADQGRIAVVAEPLTLYFFDGANRISRGTANVVAGHRAVFQRIYERQTPDEAARLRRYHDFHLAQTKAYWVLSGDGVLLPALRNLAAPHPRTTRKSSLHLLYTGLKRKLGLLN